MLLGDLGADVIKVEGPAGDDTRAWGPPFWGDRAEGLSAYFTSVNRNKRSVTLDLKTTPGRQALADLVRDAHLLFHNFRPATAKRLGLDPDTLRGLNPNLVTAVVAGFAGDEVARNRPAYDLLAQAVSGLMSVTGDEGGEPHKVGVAVLDLLVGLEVALGALAALLDTHDRPVRHVEVSLVEAGLTGLVNVLANYLASGEEPRRYGSAHPNIAPYQSFATRDGHVVVAAGNDGQFQRLLDVLGLEDTDARYSSNADRLRGRRDLIDWIGGAIAERGRDELVEALHAADVPAGSVLTVGDAVASMEQAHQGAWVERADGIRLAPSPFRLDGRRPAIRRPPPRLGQHTEEVIGHVPSAGEARPAIDRGTSHE
jgi:formyl-CoA transferase/CoA:oxalate CoA-transferase